uniref:C2H2-type domain-containing protein n=1 Tax=Poecilia formosa TaxID=48698 RepID=A0A087X3P2_POEFO
MSSVQHLREFIKERLTAAAEEIFTEVEKTIVRYEEDIKLLENCLKPQIKLTRIDQPQQHVCNKEEVQIDPQICNQEQPSLLHMMQNRPEPEMLKEIQKLLLTHQRGISLSSSREVEKTIVRYEKDIKLLETHWKPQIKLTRIDLQNPHVSFEEKTSAIQQVSNQERRSSHDQEEAEPQWTEEDQKGLCSSQEGEQLVQKQEGDLSREPTTDHYFHISNVIESKDQEGISFTVSESESDTDIKERSLKCDICGKGFENQHNFKKHCRTHRPFSCETCSKCFSNIGHLNMHRRVHTGEKPFSCQVCKKTFSQEGNLKVHMRIHTGEKPFSCQVCRRKFTQIGGLKRHKKIHTGEKPFSCQVCRRKFTQIGGLKRHKKIHTG